MECLSSISDINIVILNCMQNIGICNTFQTHHMKLDALIKHTSDFIYNLFCCCKTIFFKFGVHMNDFLQHSKLLKMTK